MDEDWTAVGRAISDRLDERGMTMTDLANQAEISLTTVRELVHASSTRQRHPRTLGKLSRTLGWPEDHLLRVLRGDLGDGSADESGSRRGELDDLRDEVRELRQRVEALEDRSP